MFSGILSEAFDNADAEVWIECAFLETERLINRCKELDEEFASPI